jgi:hypothetical protein
VLRNRFAGAALCAALAAGCGRAPKPAPDPGNGVTLQAPAPSSATVASPLGEVTTGYTNEMQAENLRGQAAELGISRLTRPSSRAGAENDDAPHRTITYQEGVERTRDMAAEAEAERHAIEGDKNKSVAIPSDTAGVLPKKNQGAPIENVSESTGP